MELSEKELLLLEAYRTASSTEKQKVESILKVHKQTELEELRKQEWSDKNTNKMQAIEFLEKSAEEALHSIAHMLDSNKLDSSAKEFSVRYYGNSLEFMFLQAWDADVITDAMYDDFRKKFNEMKYSDKVLKADVWKQMKKEVINSLKEKMDIPKEKKVKKKEKSR